MEERCCGIIRDILSGFVYPWSVCQNIRSGTCRLEKQLSPRSVERLRFYGCYIWMDWNTPGGYKPNRAPSCTSSSPVAKYKRNSRYENPSKIVTRFHTGFGERDCVFAVYFHNFWDHRSQLFPWSVLRAMPIHLRTRWRVLARWPRNNKSMIRRLVGGIVYLTGGPILSNPWWLRGVW
jgi:hypothetical protein